MGKRMSFNIESFSWKDEALNQIIRMVKNIFSSNPIMSRPSNKPCHLISNIAVDGKNILLLYMTCVMSRISRDSNIMQKAENCSLKWAALVRTVVAWVTFMYGIQRVQCYI